MRKRVRGDLEKIRKARKHAIMKRVIFWDYFVSVRNESTGMV